jgi:hypothetical protein
MICRKHSEKVVSSETRYSTMMTFPRLFEFLMRWCTIGWKDCHQARPRPALKNTNNILSVYLRSRTSVNQNTRLCLFSTEHASYKILYQVIDQPSSIGTASDLGGKLLRQRTSLGSSMGFSNLHRYSNEESIRAKLPTRRS